MNESVVIDTPRLRLRQWRDSDYPHFAAMNADPRVMEHFPAPLDRRASDAFAERLRAALAHGFELLGLDEIVFFTALPNLRSQAVMRRIGMRHDGEIFEHPNVAPGHRLRPHCLYRHGIERGEMFSIFLCLDKPQDLVQTLAVH